VILQSTMVAVELILMPGGASWFAATPSSILLVPLGSKSGIYLQYGTMQGVTHRFFDRCGLKLQHCERISPSYDRILWTTRSGWMLAPTPSASLHDIESLRSRK
jgi:hypothetical protein